MYHKTVLLLSQKKKWINIDKNMRKEWWNIAEKRIYKGELSFIIDIKDNKSLNKQNT